MTTPTTPTLDDGYQIPEEERGATGARRRRDVRGARRAPEPPVGREALRRLRRRRLGRSRVPHRPRRSALGAAGGRRARRHRLVPRASRSRCAPRIGLHMIATFMKIGLQFESVLKRGLLEFALRAAERLAGVPLRLPRGHRGGAALADVPGVRQPHRLRHPRPRLVAALRRAPGGAVRPDASRSCSSSSCSAARTRSTTCSARRCAAAARCTRCSSASCRSTSPRRRATSASRATT